MRGSTPRHEDGAEQLPAVEGVILDAAEMRPGDRVVYPNQGVCRVTGSIVQLIAGHELELVRMEREEDGAAVLVPKGKVPSIGLRKVASGDQIEGVFHYLAAQFDDPELDWKVRHRDNADRLIAGGVLGVAEVVKGLHALSRIRPLPAKEREQYDNARHLLVHEVAVSLHVPPALAEDYIDYALMPPAGVTFKLKPPPKPVTLPSRPRRRVVRTDDEDLELDDLGLDLGAGLGAVAEGAEPGEDAPIPAVPALDDVPLPDPLADLALPDEAEGEGAAEPEEEAAAAEDEGGAEEGEAEPEAEPEPEEDEAPHPAARAAKPAPKKGETGHAKKAAEKHAPEKSVKKAPAEKKAAKAPAKKEPVAKAAAKKPAARKAEAKPVAKASKASKPAAKGKKR